MRKQDLEATPFTEVFIKKTSFEKDGESAERSLVSYAERHGFLKEKVIYDFVKKSIEREFFFKNYDNLVDLLIKAVHWASWIEKRQKPRILSSREIKDKNRPNFFISLQKVVIKGMKKEEFSEVGFDIRLDEVLRIFFELSCVRRSSSRYVLSQEVLNSFSEKQEKG